MSFNLRGERIDHFSPLGNVQTDFHTQTGGGGITGATLYQSPASYPQSWGDNHGDLGSGSRGGEFEMRDVRGGSGSGGVSGGGGWERNGGGRPPMRQPNSMGSMASEYSTSSTVFPSHEGGRMNTEHSPFLLDPLHKFNTDINALSVPYKDHGGKQFRDILKGMSLRLCITILLCIAYALVALAFQRKGPKTETQKKTFNTITTGISICLGLNIASAFKDIALNMRWFILRGRKRSLKEINLILSADSMMKVAKIVLISRRPIVVFACFGWLFINILAQAGIAMISLTYGWETDRSALLLQEGTVTVPRMDYFYPQVHRDPFADPPKPSVQDEAYTAHQYGGLINNYGFNDSAPTKRDGDILLPADNLLFLYDDSARWDFHFANYPPGDAYIKTDYSSFTNRTISSNHSCIAYPVTANGNGSFTEITVATIGPIFISHKSPDSTTFFTNRPNGEPNTCGRNTRCSIVEAFEASDTHPWYYRCNITIQETRQDPQNISWVPDRMALIAGSAIAQVGYTDDGQESQIYPRGSFWGVPLNGSAPYMGRTISLYALGSIASAALYNPVKEATSKVPMQGTQLKVGHKKFFAVILGLIVVCHALFVLGVALVANKAKIGPDNHLEMALLLRPVAERLEGVRSNSRDGGPYDLAVRRTKAVYEMEKNGRWGLVVS